MLPFLTTFLLYFLSTLFFIASSISIGKQNTTVFDLSLDISDKVDRVLKCNAPGVDAITLAALARLSDASNSPLAFVITAVFYLSAPNGSEALSIILHISSDILSLSAKSSSNVTEPTTLRIVV